MRRVSVVGGSCTGKTTLARLLAEQLAVLHVEVDALHHGRTGKWWVVKTHRRYHRIFPARLAVVPGLRVVRLRSSRAVRRWLATLD